MDLFDFFFPDQAQATHLRKIAASQRLASASSRTAARQTDEIAALRSDVQFLTLVVTAILKRLAENQTMSLADVQDLLGEVDALDGATDGGLDPGVLRGLLGVLKSEHVAVDPDQEALEAIAEIHRRYRRA